MLTSDEKRGKLLKCVVGESNFRVTMTIRREHLSPNLQFPIRNLHSFYLTLNPLHSCSQATRQRANNLNTDILLLELRRSRTWWIGKVYPFTGDWRGATGSLECRDNFLGSWVKINSPFCSLEWWGSKLERLNCLLRHESSMGIILHLSKWFLGTSTWP